MAKQKRARQNTTLTIEEHGQCVIARHGIGVIENVNDSGLLTLVQRTYPLLVGDKDRANKIKDYVREQIPEKKGRKSLLDLNNISLRSPDKQEQGIKTKEVYKIDEADFDEEEEEEWLE